jgi:hypothetical protein
MLSQDETLMFKEHGNFKSNSNATRPIYEIPFLDFIDVLPVSLFMLWC